jgi:hypothetical protein
MMYLDHIFLDFNDGRFSNAMSEALKMTGDLGLESTYYAFSSLLEAKIIATELAKRERLASPGSETYESLIEDLRIRFVNVSENLFEKLWHKEDTKGISRQQKITYRFRAIRVLKLGRIQAAEEDLRARLDQKYMEHVDRLFAFGGTVKSAEGAAIDYWEGGNHGAAIDILRAGIIWHESAKIRVGTDVLRKNIRKYTTIYSQKLMEEASRRSDPQQAESLAIQALKAHMVGHSLDAAMLREVWVFVEKALEDKFSQVEQRIKDLSSSGKINESIEMIKRSFWLLPEQLEKRYEQLEKVAVKHGIEQFLKKSRAAKKLSAKIATLEEALNVLNPYLKTHNPVQERASLLKDLRLMLTSSLESARQHMDSKLYPEVVKGFKDAERQAGIFVKQNREPLSSAALSSLAVISKQAESELHLAEEKLAISKQEANPAESWKLAAESLDVYPHSPEVQAWKSDLEEKLALSGDILDLNCGEKNYRWYVRKSLTIARDGGDVPLSLWSISSDKQPIEFRWEQGNVAVIDHNTRHGVYYRVASRGKAYTRIKGTFYQRFIPQRPSLLKGEGELVVGLIGRIAWRTFPAGVVLTFKQPYTPQELDKNVSESLEQLWPDWENETSVSIILSPKEVSIGSGELHSIKLPGSRSNAAMIKKDTDRFLMVCRDGSLMAQGLSQEEVFLMTGVSYRLGTSQLSFEAQ